VNVDVDSAMAEFERMKSSLPAEDGEEDGTPPAGAMLVTVDLPPAMHATHGPTVTVAVDPTTESVADLKAKVAAQTGVPPSEQDLAFGGSAIDAPSMATDVAMDGPIPDTVPPVPVPEPVPTPVPAVPQLVPTPVAEDDAADMATKVAFAETAVTDKTVDEPANSNDGDMSDGDAVLVTDKMVVEAQPKPVESPELSGMEQVKAMLKSMGFLDETLIDAVIAKHGEDIDSCASELATASEWASLLDDLAEMGFQDRERNKTLMLKNSGNIKRTVKDLIEA